MSNTAKLLNLQNSTAEEAVLHEMCRDTGLAVYMAEQLNEDCFSVPENKLMFLGLNHLLMGIEPIDSMGIVSAANSIAKERKLGTKLTTEYVDSLKPANVMATNYVTTLQRFSWLRSWGDFAYWMVDSLQRNPDPEELFAQANEKLVMLQPKSRQKTNFVYGWDTGEYQKGAIDRRLEEFKEGKNHVYNFPWDSWNEIIVALSGGMIGTLYGPTKSGKSIYFEQVAEHWATLGHVVLVHLEDDLEYKLNRRSARHSLVEYNRILTGNLTQNEVLSVADSERVIQASFGAYLHYYHAPGQSMAEICREIEARRDEGVCDAVVLDYLDKVQPSRTQMQLFGSNIWERQANDMELFKISCEKKIRGKSVPGFSGGQFTKNGQDGDDVSAKDISGSGQKLHKAQLVTMFNRRRVGDAGLCDQNGNEIARPGSKSPFIDFTVVAQNQGEDGSFRQVIDGKRFRIKDLPKTERVNLSY